MKKGISLLPITACLLFAAAGCQAPDTANTQRNRDDLARMKGNAQNYERNGGNLGGDYVANLLLNGSGKKSNKPLFDQSGAGPNPR